MEIVDLKVWGLNMFALTITLMDVDLAISAMAALTALGYTVHKWILLYKSNQKKKNGS